MATTTELRDKDLFDAVLAHIEANPWQHNQRTYGKREDGVMTGCVAFLAVLLADGPDVFVWSDDDGGVEHTTLVQLTEDSEEIAISARARDLLGLTWAQGDDMFYSYASLDEIQGIAARAYAPSSDDDSDDD